jgi:hypothetical protein
MELLHKFVEAEGLTPRQVTTSLGGLARMRLKWEQLSSGTRRDIVTALDAVCLEFNDREIGNCLHSLSKLQLPWSGLPVSVQAGLLETFMKKSKSLVSQQGSMAIYSLGLMGLEAETVTQAVRDHIFIVALAVLEETKVSTYRSVSQQTSNVIYGLAKMGFKWASIPLHVQEGIEDAIRNVIKYMNEQEVANTIYSFSLLGVSWDQLSGNVRNDMVKIASLKMERMIPQGLSNTLYGMALMGARWHDDTNDVYQTSVEAAITKNFGTSFPRTLANDKERGSYLTLGGMPDSSQAIANVIYSLGITGAVWHEFRTETREALYDGVVRWAPELTSQELSNTVYGLGMLKTEYSELPLEVVDALAASLSRVMTRMNDQEVCSTLHGFAKMNASWDGEETEKNGSGSARLMPELRKSMLVCIASLAEIGALCLACTVYSLGMLGATWERLPARIRYALMLAAKSCSLRDQTISNVIYGLSLLKVQWASLDTEFRDILLDSMSQKDAYAKDTSSQHIANTIWGLAKMDASWDHLQGQDRLMGAFVRACQSFSAQEASNSIYGLAVMDAPWNSLSAGAKVALAQALERTAGSMTHQEVANVMYSLAIMTFDAIYELDIDTELSSAGSQALWDIHAVALSAFAKIPKSEYEKENYDQFAMYFEFLDAIPGGRSLMEKHLKQHAQWCNQSSGGSFHIPPKISGPSANVPSRLHARTVGAMLASLQKSSISRGEKLRWEVFNEFSGLRGIFPIDAAVYCNGDLVALVEIDGEFHYKEVSAKLRRKDQLKEYLYRKYYPNLPLFRIRSDQCSVLGIERAGDALANWIISSLGQPDSTHVDAITTKRKIRQAGEPAAPFPNSRAKTVKTKTISSRTKKRAE